MFTKDMLEMARLMYGLKHTAELHDEATDELLRRCDHVFDLFHKKYPKLGIMVSREVDTLRPRLFLVKTTVKDAFKVASSLQGLTHIGLQGFEEAGTDNAQRFQQTAEAVESSVFLSYSQEGEIGTLALTQQGDDVEVHYEFDQLKDLQSVELLFLEKFAEVGEDLDLLTPAYQIGFLDLDDEAVFAWEDEFRPKHLE